MVWFGQNCLENSPAEGVVKLIQLSGEAQENFSDLVLFGAILGPFHLLKPFSRKMTNFTNKMTLIEFQIHSASKITHLQVHYKDFCH